jgi:hypothetical protein
VVDSQEVCLLMMNWPMMMMVVVVTNGYYDGVVGVAVNSTMIWLRLMLKMRIELLSLLLLLSQENELTLVRVFRLLFGHLRVLLCCVEKNPAPISRSAVFSVDPASHLSLYLSLPAFLCPLLHDNVSFYI